MNYLQNNMNQQHQQTIQQKAAQLELDKIEKSDKRKDMILCAIMCFILLIISFLMKSWGGIILFSLTAIGSIIGVYEINNRKKYLTNIVQGKRIIQVCPNCKSPNIKRRMVKTGSKTTYNTTYISKNVNPFMPFTHTNVNKGDSNSTYNYGNKCHCQCCGYVFDKPETLTE